MPIAATSKRHRLLLPAAFGVHDKVTRDMRSLFEARFAHSTFFFYEFFLERPFTRWDSKATVLGRVQAVTAPFLPRVVYQTGFIPALDVDVVRKLKRVEDIQVVPLTPGAFRTHWTDLDQMKFRIKDSEVLQGLVKAWWKDPANRKPRYLRKWRVTAHDGDVMTMAGRLSADYLRDTYPKEILRRAKREPKYVEAALAKLREYELVLRPWLRSRDTQDIGMVAASISSKSIFWGECILLFPFLPRDSSRGLPAWVTTLEKEVSAAVHRIFVPMLTLLENYIHEDELADALKPHGLTRTIRTVPASFTYKGMNEKWFATNEATLKRIGSGQAEPSRGCLKDPLRSDHLFVSLLGHCSDAPKRWSRSLSRRERALVELWADRLAILGTDSYAVSESLVFAKYLVASPAMIERTEQAIALHHMGEHPGGKDRSVKTALVVGGPGSGKDSMAQLIRLFSPGYRFCELRTLNMAMFRPKEAAVPVLLGLEIGYTGGSSPTAASSRFTVDGLLHRALTPTGPVPTPGTSISPRPSFTFILDELNSLDMDTQGALLRFLENAELQPLGGLESTIDRMDLLVIGVMNEDPNMIMKRRVMDRVLRERQVFGGVVGEVLYEVFRNQRRLRDDLYYRFVRGGEIYIPELKDRREDIPILFYFIISTALKPLIPQRVRSKWEVELPVYEALMDPSLQWEGNLRELQTAARQIVLEAVNEYDDAGGTGSVLTIRGSHARQVLQRSSERASE